MVCTYSIVELKYPEQRKLPVVPKVPQFPPGVAAKPAVKQLIDIRGPELTDNYLTHKQYGIRVCALCASSIKCALLIN